MLGEKCIFCGKNIEAESEEHIFPDAIGGSWTIDSVCKPCNDKLGRRVDCLLTQEPLILYLRNKYKIPNKENEFVDLTKELKFFDSQGERVFFQKGDGKNSPDLYIGTKPEVTMQDNRIVRFSGSDYKSVVKKIQREIKREGIRITTDDIQQAMQTGKQTYKMECVKAPIYFNIDNFYPCVLKIVYETASYVLGDSYINDECGCQIRKFLNEAMFKRAVETWIKIMHPETFDLSSARKLHFIQIGYNDQNGTLDAIVGIFGCCIFFVTVSKNPSHYMDAKLPFIYTEILE